VPAQGGRPAQGGVPTQGRPAGAHARGATPAEADGGQRAQGGASTPKRDGRVSGDRGQSGRRDGRSSGGAHARRPGSPAGGQNAPAGQGAPGGQDGPVPAGFGPRRPQRLQYQAPSIDGGAHVETSTGPGVPDDFARVGRNDPCPCGSGRKYKRCHGDPRTRPDA
jgi:preprotein translocase subunit SecA